MKIVNVIPLKKGLPLDDLTYFTSKDVDTGNIVSMTLRTKIALGLVVSQEDASGAKISIKDMKFNLKKILEVKGKSVFLKEYLDSALLLGKYFASSKNNAITSLVPAIFREEYDKISDVKVLTSTIARTVKNINAEKLILQESIDNRISTYKTLIRENFGLNKSVFLVLPNENDVGIFYDYLSRGIEQFTYSVHGGLSAKKIVEQFKQIASSVHPLFIIGTAPFLSIPRPDIGVIILEHESSNGYRMVARPHFDLRVFVEIFASKINAKFILGDNLLRFETITKEVKNGLGYYIPMHPMTFRINFSGEIQVENPRLKYGNKEKQEFKIFSQKSIEEIQNTIVNEKNVFIFTLRKGLATQTICRDCNEIVSCSQCLSPLVLYNLTGEGKNKKRMFVCNRCGDEKPGEVVCASCGSWNLMPLGIGTDTVFEELSKTFTQNKARAKIFKLDKESAKTKTGAEKIIKEFEENPGSILIGTEMAIHYLKKKVALAVIASFDSFWSIPNFKMSEKIIQLAASMISVTQDKFIIQTKNEEDASILAISSRNLLPFVREELEDRQNMNYPPFKRFIKIKHLGNKAETIKARQILEESLQDYSPLIFSGFVERVKGKYATNALIKLDPKNWSLPEISLDSFIDENLLGKLLSLPPSFEIYVDPEDLL